MLDIIIVLAGFYLFCGIVRVLLEDSAKATISATVRLRNRMPHLMEKTISLSHKTHIKQELK